jgi:hypothetical protein
MANWTTHIKKFVNGQRKVLKVECYHGDSREEMLELLAENKLDVLVTSYNTLASDYKKYQEHLEKDDNEAEDDDLAQLQGQLKGLKLAPQVGKEEEHDDDEVVEIASSSRPRRATRKTYAEDLSVSSGSGNESAFESEDEDSDDDESLDDSVEEDESAGEWDEDSYEDLVGDEPMFIFEHSFHRIVLDGKISWPFIYP